MRPRRRYNLRLHSSIVMRELEAGDKPTDGHGRDLPFVPGDFYVLSPFEPYVLGRELARQMYTEATPGEVPG